MGPVLLVAASVAAAAAPSEGRAAFEPHPVTQKSRGFGGVVAANDLGELGVGISNRMYGYFGLAADHRWSLGIFGNNYLLLDPFTAPGQVFSRISVGGGASLYLVPNARSLVTLYGGAAFALSLEGQGSFAVVPTFGAEFAAMGLFLATELSVGRSSTILAFSFGVRV